MGMVWVWFVFFLVNMVWVGSGHGFFVWSYQLSKRHSHPVGRCVGFKILKKREKRRFFCLFF